MAFFLGIRTFKAEIGHILNMRGKFRTNSGRCSRTILPIFYAQPFDRGYSADYDRSAQQLAGSENLPK